MLTSKKLSFALVALIITFLSTPLLAQEKSEKKLKNEIAWDASGIFRDNGSNLNLLYRRYMGKGALRFQLDFDGSKPSAKNETIINYGYSGISSGKNHSYTYGLGWEWHKNHAKFQFIYGADLIREHYKSNVYHTRYSNWYSENENIEIEDEYETIYERSTIKISPLLGARYKVSNRFLVGIEIASSFNFNQSKKEEIHSKYNGETPTEPQGSLIQEDTWSARFFSRPSLLVSYRF